MLGNTESKRHFVYLVSQSLLVMAFLMLLLYSNVEPSKQALKTVTAETTTTIIVTTTSSSSTTMPPAPPTTIRPPRASRGGVSRPTFTGDVWQALGNCESHNTNDHYAPFYGYFQFSESTWHGVGESGLPDQYPYEVQLAAAKRLQARSGWGQWPVCSRKLGLR